MRLKFILLDSLSLLCLIVDADTFIHPKENFTTRDFITANGFPYEEHLVLNPNGVISVLNRISHGPSESYNQSRIPVLMFHGASTSSKMWISNNRNDSLAFVLVDNGFDVWLANERGSFYNLQYNKMLRNNPYFWDYSFQELGMIDCPLMIDFILNTTRHKKLFYVGMSLGSTIGFTLLSTRTEYNDKIHALIALSPVVYMKHANPIFSLGFILQIQQRMFGNGGSLPELLTYFLRSYLWATCSKLGLLNICIKIVFFTFGDQFIPSEEENLPLLAILISDMTSLKMFVHFWQLVASGEFRMYDYGIPEVNLKIYNHTVPPQFDLSKVTAPVALFPGLHDNIGDGKDVQMLAMKLPNLKFNSPILNCKGCGHTSSASPKAAVILFPKLIAFMKKTVLFP